MAWRHEEVLQLIDLYRDGAELWDTENPDYKNNYKRSSKLHLICKKMQRSQWDVKNKIKNLRTTFYRARKNCLNKKQGRMWVYYSALSFLDIDKDNNYDSDGDTQCKNSEESDTEKGQSDLDEFEEERCIWTQDECLTLIELLRDNESLWNTNSALYNNHQSKINAYKKISEVLKKDTPDIKYKIKTLRTILTRTHKKIQKAVDEHGCYAGKIWFAYEPLSFMLKGSNYTPIKITKRVDKDDEIEYESDRNNGHLEGTNEYNNHLKYWDMDETIKLIKMFEKHEELWNASHKNYSLKVEKQKILKQFAKILNRHVVDISSKLQNLKTQYYREVRKFHEAEINSTKKERVWFGYKHMSFLSRSKTPIDHSEKDIKNELSVKSEEYIVKEEPFQDVLIADASDSDISTDFELDREDQSYSNKMTKKSRETSSDSDFDRVKTYKGPVKSRKRSSVYLEQVEQDLTKEDIKNSSRRSSEDFERQYFSDPLQDPDEFITFGQFISQELRKITDACTLIKAKNDISNIIFNAQSQSIKKRKT